MVLVPQVGLLLLQLRVVRLVKLKLISQLLQRFQMLYLHQHYKAEMVRDGVVHLIAMKMVHGVQH
ncbi:hypothetical protein D3C86_2241440 [compost metagenome]